MILHKITRFLDFLIVLVTKPVDFIVSLCARDFNTPLEAILCIIFSILGLPICVVLGLLSTVLSLIRLFFGGDIDESQKNNSDV